MKKVLIFNHVGILGGSSVSLMQIIESIDTNKYELQIATVCKPNNISKELTNKGYNVINLSSEVLSYYYFNGGSPPFLSPASLKNIYNIFKARREVREILSKNKYDIVIVNSMTMFYIGKIAKKFGLKTVCFMRETFPNKIFSIRKSMIIKSMIKNFDAIAFISKFDQKDFSKYKGKAYTIYDKVDVDRFLNQFSSPLELADSPKTKKILYLGGLSKLKGAHVALELIKELGNNYQLIFIGTDFVLDYFGSEKETKLKYRDYCAKFVLKNNLRDKILFLPPNKYVERYYFVADFVIFPATLPHQSRPIYESNFASKRILIPSYENLLEFNYSNVVFYKKGNLKDLIDMITSNFMYEKEISIDKIAIKRHSIDGLAAEVNNLLNNL